MTVPTISNLPTVPATSDPNFETEAPALFNHIKNTFVSEMNSAISFINSSTFDATVEFKNANFTAARNFLYMIDTSSAAVSVTLPANPSTGDQLLLMDQKRTFATNNLTIGRNSQNINGAASDVVSKSTGALIRCVYNSTYGWTVDLYEGQWESGTSAGDLVYNGGKVGIGTSSPGAKLHVRDATDNGTAEIVLANGDTGLPSENHIVNKISFYQEDTSGGGTGTTGAIAMKSKKAIGYTDYFGNSADMSFYVSGNVGGTASDNASKEAMTIQRGTGNVGIGTSAPDELLHIYDTGFVKALIENNSSGNDPIFEWKITGGQSWTAGIDNSDSDKFKIAASNFLSTSTAMTIDSSGKVGIGTSSPDAKLEIGIGASNADGLLVTSDNNALVTGDHIAAVSGRGSTDAYNLLKLENSTGTQMIVQGDGNVGIGTSSPNYELTIGGGDTSSSLQILSSTTGTTATDGLRIWNTGASTAIWNYDNTPLKLAVNNDSKLEVLASSDVEILKGNLVIGTAGKGIDFGVASGSVTSQLLDDYEEGTFTPAFIDTNGDATFTHDIQKGKYTKVGDCVYFSLTIGTDSVTAGTGDLKISGLPFAAQNSEPQIKPSGAVGVNYSWSTSPISWLIEANSNAIILYKSVNPLSASKSTDCGTTADDNRLYINGFYFV